MSTAEYDIETGELIERELTAEEQAELAQRQAESSAAASIEETERTNEQTLRDQLVVGLNQIDTHLVTLNGAPTVAEQRAALIFALRAIKRLARLQLRILDSTD